MEEFKDKLKSGFGKATSALKEPEGLATAALGAFLINPVVGLALGIGQGILARRDRQSALEEAAADRAMLQSFDKLHQEAVGQVQGLASTDLDRAQLEQLGRDYAPLQQLAMHPDPAIRKDALFKMAEMSTRVGDWLEDLEGRNEAVFDSQVGVLDKAADTARMNRETAIDQGRQVASVAEQFHSLLSDPTFDVNSPAGRARMGQLLEQTPREFLADPADFSDTLEKVGANAPGVIGAITSYFAGKMKAEEFTFTKEDWRKVAYAMQTASKHKTDQAISDAERVGVTLDRAAGGLGYKPAYSYLDRIMTGEVQDVEGVSGAPGVYDEIQRAEAERRAATANAAEAAEPSRTSKVVATAKEKAADVISSKYLDPTGFWKRMFGREGGLGTPKKERRPTN